MTYNFPHLYPHDIPIKCWVFHFFQVISSLHRSGLQLRLLATPQPVSGLPWATLRLRGKPRKMMYKWWGFHIYVSLLSGNPCLGPKKMMQNKSWTHVLTVSPFFPKWKAFFVFSRLGETRTQGANNLCKPSVVKLPMVWPLFQSLLKNSTEAPLRLGALGSMKKGTSLATPISIHKLRYDEIRLPPVSSNMANFAKSSINGSF